LNLRATHHGYAYQDLVCGIALVDLALGSAESVTVDAKRFAGDRFDDLTIAFRGRRRVRLQIKHTVTDRELTKATFTADARNLKLDKLFNSVLHDLTDAPETTFRVVVRDGHPEDDLARVLKPIDVGRDLGDPLVGLSTSRYQFDPEELAASSPWKDLVSHLSKQELDGVCRQLVIDTNAPQSSLSFADPGQVERVLLRRATEELGAGRPPNSGISPESVARALASAATGARAIDGMVARGKLLPELGLVTDFGAVVEGHPVEAAVAVHRDGAAAEVSKHIELVTPAGGRVVVTGEPGVGKSWLCEQLADTYRQEGWIVARHHCWLGRDDVNQAERRVLTNVVIGSLLRQLEKAMPGATVGLQPRFAATIDALTWAVGRCREIDQERNVLLIVDGLDHIDRILGRNTNQAADPSRLLVDELAGIDLPPGVSLLLASQPGPHLASFDLSNGLSGSGGAGGSVRMPRMSRDEVHTLAVKHGVLPPPGRGDAVDEDDERAIVDLVHERSGGNALYATYLCRHATRVSPLEAAGSEPVTAIDMVGRLMQVPVSANDLDAYYKHLLAGMTEGQHYAIRTLALCDFALSADELGEVLPAVKPLLGPALDTLAPVLNSQPSLGGLRIHHESFSRHILRDWDSGAVRSIRQAVAAWLTARGFLADARAFRHLPDLLARLNRYDELKALIEPGFVADAIEAFQPPEALTKVVGIVARESQMRLDWPTLITCVETRKSIDTYESESLTDSIVQYADVVVAILGADAVAERMMYEGRTTFEARWGLRICASVDRAGAAAPWKAYMDAWKSESERSTKYSSDSDGSLQLALQRGALRLRAQRRDYPATFVKEIAAHLQWDHEASLGELVEVFASGLPAGMMLEVAAAMTDPSKAAQVYLTLADLAATGEPGLPAASDLAREAWNRAPGLNIACYLKHGIAPTDVVAGMGCADLDDELNTATNAVLASGSVKEADVGHWLSLLALAHGIDRSLPLKQLGKLGGPGFYRAWLRYAVATVGLADDVANDAIAPKAASSAVLAALDDLAAQSHSPFIGDPDASRLYFIHPLIHQVIENSLAVVDPDDLDEILVRFISIGDGTTTVTNLGTPPSGPLVTNDLLDILARASDHIGVESVHALLDVVEERREDANAGYGESAAFELALARICHAADATAEAAARWHRACHFLSCYGGHKDPTLSELTDSLEDIASADLDVARNSLAKLVDLVYLVVQHTDGRDTSHYVNQWWERAADIDPTAAAMDGADVLLSTVGLEDSRAHAAHKHLLAHQVSTGDPIVLAALRLTVGMSWRDPSTDTELLTRLAGELGASPNADAMLAIVANNVAASYDDQAMRYASGQSSAVVTPELVDAVVTLGGPSFASRTPRPEDDRSSRRWDSESRPDPLELQKRIVSDQRPVIPEGRAGVVLAAREHQKKRYRDEIVAPSWTIDALANAIGWRIIEATINHGAAAGIELIDGIAREVATYSDNELFAVIGAGLALRADGPPSEDLDGEAKEEPKKDLRKVAAYCLSLAYIRIRGGGGWRAFAGRERADLWATAHALDPRTAEAALAAAVAGTVASKATSTYGVTQAIVAALTVTPTGAIGAGDNSACGTAAECWNAAFAVISNRLPGDADRFGHTYRPTATPHLAEMLAVAMATLAVATVAQPMRADLRQALLASTLLLTCRPDVGQAAVAHVLAADLDSGRATWLLDVVRTCLREGDLTDDLAAVATQLAATDFLSVRAAATSVLTAHDRPVPELPASEPAPSVRAAFNDLMDETR
jgi:hypothetical protein